jgi:hypothetical protein
MLFKGVIYNGNKTYPYWVELEGVPHRREIFEAAVKQTAAPVSVEQLLRMERFKDQQFGTFYMRRAFSSRRRPGSS